LPTLPAGGLEVAIEIARIAATPGAIEHRAQELLDPLHRVVPFEGAWISLLDPELREQPPLIHYGYPESFAEYMRGPGGVDEIERVGLSHNRAAIRIQDVTVPLEQLLGWAEYLAPAGFRGAVGVGLFTPYGRYLGVVGLYTDTELHPTEAARDLIGLLAPMIAVALDPMLSIAAAARIVRHAEAGVVLTRTGNTLPLPGLPTHPMLTPGSDALTAVAELLAVRQPHASFLCPMSVCDGADGHSRITMLACPPRPPYYATAVVAVSPAGNLPGLTGRELEILGLLIEDWSDQRIAGALGLPVQTVADHIARAMAKLDAQTRVLATTRALRQGLYVPRPLAHIGG
jgi:DNA-binding CsgD family transcriptional regulator